MHARGGSMRGSASQGGRSNRGRGQSNSGGGNTDGRRPNRVINVPKESQRESLARERQMIETIWATDTGCRIVPQTTGHGAGGPIITSFDIFGTGNNLEKAVHKVEEWIRQAKTKSSAATAWAKTPAFDPKAWSEEYTQSQVQKRKMKFTKEMPVELSSIYNNVVTMQWPDDLRDAEVTMKDAFGTTFAQLDSVRMEDEVFIKPVGSYQLEIRGLNKTSLESAKGHLNILIEKVRLKINNTIWPKYLVLDKGLDCGAGVLFERVPAWWPDNYSHTVSPRLLRCAVTSSRPAEYWNDLQAGQRYVIQGELERALDLARYEKGHYELSIGLGCLAIKQHDLEFDTKQDTDAFIKDIVGKEHLDCVVKKWLVDDNEGKKLLKRLMAAEDLLEPASTGLGGFSASAPQTLVDTKPTLRATWVFEDPHGTPLNYVVQVQWTIDEDGLYEKDHPKFYRLPPGFKARKECLDVKLLELGESKAWQFSLSSMSPVNRQLVPAAIHIFVQNLKFNPNFDSTSGGRFVEFKAGYSLKMITGRLDKLYSFGIRKTGYKLDFIRMWYPYKDAPCWGLNVYHNEWQSHLAVLEQLQPGERGDWGDTVSTFLPDDGFTATGTATAIPQPSTEVGENGNPQPRDGIRMLLVKLMEISQVVHQADSIEMPEYPAIAPSPRTLV